MTWPEKDPEMRLKRAHDWIVIALIVAIGAVTAWMLIAPAFT